MSKTLFRRLPFSIPLLLLFCCVGAAQEDTPLVPGSQRTDEMKRMIREFIDEAQRLENEGDKAGAILMKNKASGLLKSLRSINAPQVRPRSNGATTPPPEPPTITRAEAVVTLQKSINMLDLLGEKELGRRVKMVMSGIASEREVAEIMEYHNQTSKNPRTEPTTPTAPPNETTSDNNPTPSPASTPQRTVEQIQNQVIALKASMDALLDFEQNEEARLLAQSIMLRRKALSSSKLNWVYPADYQKPREIELLRLASKRLFEGGNIASSKLANDLANRLAQEQRNETADAKNKASDAPSTAEQKKQSITRLTQEFQKSESARMKILNENRQLQRLNATLQKEIKNLRESSDKAK